MCNKSLQTYNASPYVHINMPRPQIDEDLHAQVRQIHTQIEGDSPESFQEALKTVISLALVQIEQDGKPLNDWYLGKNIERTYSTIRSAFNEDSSAAEDSNNEAQFSEHQEAQDIKTQKSREKNSLDNASISLDQLKSMAVFKTEISENGDIRIPAAERRALQLSEGELLQVIANRLRENKSDR